MRKKYGWIVAGIMLFIIVNVVLIGVDKNNKVDRIAYISDWTKLQKKDIPKRENRANYHKGVC